MIELQGDLVKKAESWDNQKLGDLQVRDGTPFLTIGIHELEGEFVTLKKPFVVLDPQQEEDETVTTCRGVECRSKFTVAGVIRRKVLFKLRPHIGVLNCWLPVLGIWHDLIENHYGGEVLQGPPPPGPLIRLLAGR